MSYLTVQNAVKRFGPNFLALNDVSIAVEKGEFFTLLGPSGCGKTTLLRSIAGFNDLTSGSITLDGGNLRVVPPHQRDIGMVFQDYAIFPHLSVFDNVAFGLKPRKVPASEIKTRVMQALAAVRLEAMVDRLPAAMSGGQQQRIGLARAMVINPRLLLMDEPLSNLDAKLRIELRSEIRDIQKKVDIATIYVTHDQEEALAISDRVIVMNVGIIEQIGTPEDIYNRPRSRFVADFVGSANLIKGKFLGNGRFAADGGVTLEVTAGHTPHGKESEVAVRTAYVDLEPRPGDNHVPGKVRQRLFHGDFVQYVIDSAIGSLIVRRPPVNLLSEGADVTLSFSPEHCVLLEA